MAPRTSSRSGSSSLQSRLREERAAVYRQAIADAAERVFAEKGADRITPELCFGGKGHEDIEPQISRINTDYFYLCHP